MPSHYGIHADGDLVFLHQQEGGVCLTPGLERLASPFSVDCRLKCPHGVNIGGARAPVPAQPIVQKLGPVPDGGAYWVPPEAMAVLLHAHKACSPVRPIFFTPWADRIRELIPELTVTNAAPMIIGNYELKDVSDLYRLLALPRVRTVILCGPIRPPGVTEIPFTPFDAESTDWPGVGLSLLDAYVRSLQ